MEPGQVSLCMFVLMWTLTGWWLPRFHDSNQYWAFWFTINAFIFHEYMLTFCWWPPLFLSSTTSLFGCTLFCNKCLFPSSYPIIFQSSCAAWVKETCLEAFISSLFLAPVFQNKRQQNCNSCCFLSPQWLTKEEKLIWQQIHLESHFRDGLFEKRKKYPDTFEFFGSQPLRSGADVPAGNATHPLVIDMQWAALSFWNNIR